MPWRRFVVFCAHLTGPIECLYEHEPDPYRLSIGEARARGETKLSSLQICEVRLINTRTLWSTRHHPRAQGSF